MNQKMLDSATVSEFCGEMASMYSVGIQLDEALGIMSENNNDPFFAKTCFDAYCSVSAGAPLSEALRKTDAFPGYVVSTLAAGEESGQIEGVLGGLAQYYHEESRLLATFRQSITYPAILLCVIAVIIAFTIYGILPVFYQVYDGFVGSLAASSFGSLAVSTAIGCIALAVTVICAALCLICAFFARKENGRQRLIRIFEKTPFTRDLMYKFSLSRFMGNLSMFVHTETTIEGGMQRALELVAHEELRAKLDRAYASMIDLSNPCGISQALSEQEVFDSSYARMIAVSSVNGNIAETASYLSEVFFDEAVHRMERTIGNVEPVMAAFMTLAISATLIAVMLPLIGIMGSLG